jgi:LemA protein
MSAQIWPLQGRRPTSASKRGMSFRRIARTWVQACILGVSLSGCGINNIPAYQEIARAKWSDLLYAYSLRDDLIRNFVNVVQGHVAQGSVTQESQALEELGKARSRAHQAQLNLPTEILNDRDAFMGFSQVQGELTAALARMLTVCERHDELKHGELKSDKHCLQSIAQLKESESRIAAARHAYNEAAEQYNRELRNFPGAFWGATLYHNNKPMQTFSGPENVRP